MIAAAEAEGAAEDREVEEERKAVEAMSDGPEKELSLMHI